MTAAEKKIQSYLDSIPADEDRKAMAGYRFLVTPLRQRISRVKAKKGTAKKVINKRITSR
jgi:hypothetical protein